MHVLVLSTWFPFPPDNGSKLRAYYLLRSLATRHDVTCIAFDPEGNHLNPAHLPTWSSALDCRAVAEDPYHRVHVPQIVKYLSPIPLAYAATKAMSRTMEGIGRAWDVIVAVQMPVARYLPNRAACGVIDVDTSLSFQMSERLHRSQDTPERIRAWISYRKAWNYERRQVRRFELALIAGQQELQHTRRLAHSHTRVEILSNGVDCAHNRPGLVAQRPNRLVYNGSLTYSANYDAMRWFLAEVYPSIKAQCPAVSLTITGSTRGVNLAGLALDESVRLTGFVEDVRLPVAEAAVCVVPIRQGGGTRLKILEAMALGTPVVATFKGAEGLDVINGEHLLLADDPESFANRTITLLSNPDLGQRLTVNARRLVETRYDWQAIGAHFVNLVEATVRDGKREIG